jgi:thioredoxin reductase
MTDVWDTVIVGGGPGGLAAAFWLARYRRRTLVLDDARPRNEDAWAVHGFPGIEDLSPVEFRRRLQAQASAAGAIIARRRVSRIEGEKGAFVVEDSAGERSRTRRVILAYGRTDRIPDIPGLRELYGTSVFHCPDCDGPSIAGCEVGVLGHDLSAARLALYLLTWTDRVTLLTHGLEPALDGRARATLERHGVGVMTDRIDRVDGHDGSLEAVRFTDGQRRPAEALFFHWGSDPASELGRLTGCDCSDRGDVQVDPASLETTVPGIYAVGDIIGRPHLTISAAAEGVRAGLAIHRSLLPEEFLL